MFTWVASRAAPPRVRTRRLRAADHSGEGLHTRVCVCVRFTFPENVALVRGACTMVWEDWQDYEFMRALSGLAVCTHTRECCEGTEAQNPIATESVGQNSWLCREPDATPEKRSIRCRRGCCASHTLWRRMPPTGSVTGYGYGYSQRPHIDETRRIRGGANMARSCLAFV